MGSDFVTVHIKRHPLPEIQYPDALLDVASITHNYPDKALLAFHPVNDRQF